MKQKLYEVVFGTHTKAGRNFDLVLLILIVISVLVVMVESVPEWHRKYHGVLLYVEWGFTILFTLEYILRIAISPNPWKYMRSYWGIIDLLAILPSYLTLIPWISMYGSFRAIRALRQYRHEDLFNLFTWMFTCVCCKSTGCAARHNSHRTGKC